MKKHLCNGLLSLVFLQLMACSESSSPPSLPAETTDIELISTTPTIFTTDVERDVQISIQFSGDILPTSVDNSSFTLSNNGASVPGSLSLSGTDAALLTPDQPLNLLTRYNPSITNSIADINGLALAQGFEWVFSTRDGIWREQQTLAGGTLENPVVIKSGETTWVFYQRGNLSSGQNDLFSRRLTDNIWTDDTLVSNGGDDGDVAGSLSVKALTNGDLLAVWQELADDGTDEIWYNRYNSESGNWSESARVTPNNVNKLRPRIVSGPSDRIFVLFDFEDSLSMATDLSFIEYSESEERWSDEQLAANDLDLFSGDGHASATIDSSGKLIIIWFENQRVWSRYFAADFDDWGNTVILSFMESIDQIDAGDTHLGTQLTVDSQDNLTAVWSQLDETLGFSFIWANRYIPGQGWGEAEKITGSTFGGYPIMQVNNDDNIMLIWQQSPLLGSENLLFSGYNFEEDQWTTADLLEESDQAASQHDLEVDNSGNFMAIWNQDRTGTFFDLEGNILNNPPSIRIRRFDNAVEDDWLNPVAISSLGGVVDKPDLAVNSRGEIIALWMQMIDGSPSIQYRLFD